MRMRFWGFDKRRFLKIKVGDPFQILILVKLFKIKIFIFGSSRQLFQNHDHDYAFKFSSTFFNDCALF